MLGGIWLKFFNRGQASQFNSTAKFDGISIKDFAKSLKGMVSRKEYLMTMWSFAGYFIIWLALTGIGFYFAYTMLASLSMSLMYIMYGMMSMTSLLLVLLELLVVLFLVVAVGFLFMCLVVAVQFGYQDRINDENKQLTPSSIWQLFKHVRKNQLLRLCLYSGLFIFLWQLPLKVVATIWASNKIVAMTCLIVNDIIVVWKGLQYSQALYLYRYKQPAFLGQSMRHALTVSKRYMAGFKFNLLLVEILFIYLPVVVWGALTGGLAYYGEYTAANPLIWIGAVLFVLGYAAMMPYMTMVSALYFEKTKAKIKVDGLYVDTFKPVEELTGEAFKD